MNRRICGVSTVLVFALFLPSCVGAKHGDDSGLFVTSYDFTTLKATPQEPATRQIHVIVSFNKSVDQTTVVPGQSLILSGEKDNNAAGQLAWFKDAFQDDTLTFTSNAPWPKIGTSLTLTLKSTIRAKDNGPMEQCKTRKPEPEQPGDCVLFFVIPG